MGIRLADLASMTDLERSEALARVTSEASPVERRLRRYELRYEISTAEMRRRVASGTMKETAEIAEWLFWSNAQPTHVAG